MMPGLNPRMMKQAMKRMGIAQQEIEALEVIIRCPDKDIIIENPEVSKVNMMGRETFQIVGKVIEKSKDVNPEITEDDIKTVMEQANCKEIEAKEAIEANNGDIAAAIISLKE